MTADPPPRNYTILVALLGAFLDGYDLMIISGALLFIKVELQLSATEIGWVGAIAFAGMVAGSWSSAGSPTGSAGRARSPSCWCCS
ncbi:hypothetical protein N8J89_19515 [Crossiella sp. CA-258035]|uniref:hypothetical protein n=1 Tax=Crossiella sp. CA-258035 TaxID=2981138 RepID=UPI0024BC6C84|nr:hypothetical protein [Crossiella sp. CA-258035]WHT23177.1 hypothetical protein N8J89_19515 [Crossiella sp. CA-258035]